MVGWKELDKGEYIVEIANRFKLKQKVYHLYGTKYAHRNIVCEYCEGKGSVKYTKKSKEKATCSFCQGLGCRSVHYIAGWKVGAKHEIKRIVVRETSSKSTSTSYTLTGIHNESSYGEESLFATKAEALKARVRLSKNKDPEPRRKVRARKTKFNVNQKVYLLSEMEEEQRCKHCKGKGFTTYPGDKNESKVCPFCMWEGYISVPGAEPIWQIKKVIKINGVLADFLSDNRNPDKPEIQYNYASEFGNAIALEKNMCRTKKEATALCVKRNKGRGKKK